MSDITAMIIDMQATDKSIHAQPTKISWSRITFVNSNKVVLETNPARSYEARHKMCFVQRPISSQQKGLNGIHHRMLEGADFYKVAINNVMSDVRDTYIICHDAKFTKQLLMKSNVETDRFKFICLSTVAKRNYPGISDYSINTLMYEFCENTAISYMAHNSNCLYNTSFIRNIFTRISILSNLKTMEDWYKAGL